MRGHFQDNVFLPPENSPAVRDLWLPPSLHRPPHLVSSLGLSREHSAQKEVRDAAQSLVVRKLAEQLWMREGRRQPAYSILFWAVFFSHLSNCCWDCTRKKSATTNFYFYLLSKNDGRQVDVAAVLLPPSKEWKNLTLHITLCTCLPAFLFTLLWRYGLLNRCCLWCCFYDGTLVLYFCYYIYINKTIPYFLPTKREKYRKREEKNGKWAWIKLDVRTMGPAGCTVGKCIQSGWIKIYTCFPLPLSSFHTTCTLAYFVSEIPPTTIVLFPLIS